MQDNIEPEVRRGFTALKLQLLEAGYDLDRSAGFSLKDSTVFFQEHVLPKDSLIVWQGESAVFPTSTEERHSDDVLLHGENVTLSTFYRNGAENLHFTAYSEQGQLHKVDEFIDSVKYSGLQMRESPKQDNTLEILLMSDAGGRVGYNWTAISPERSPRCVPALKLNPNNPDEQILRIWNTVTGGMEGFELGETPETYLPLVFATNLYPGVPRILLTYEGEIHTAYVKFEEEYDIANLVSGLPFQGIKLDGTSHDPATLGSPTPGIDLRLVGKQGQAHLFYHFLDRLGGVFSPEEDSLSTKPHSLSTQPIDVEDSNRTQPIDTADLR